MRHITLFLYNLLFLPILLILLPGYLLRIRKRGGYANKALQRFGIFDRKTAARIGRGRIWLHAVSVGEVGIAMKFAEEFHRRHPHVRFLISSTTSTGLAILERSASEWLEPIANPIDLPILTKRLIRRFRPSALLMVEGDLWPNRIAAAKSLGIPIALLNARLSSKSEKRFGKVRPLSSSFFNQLDLITLTDGEERSRWLALGLRSEILHEAGNIKHDTSSSTLPLSAEFPKSLGWSEGDPILLAASTHAGEEGEVAKAYLQLRREFPNLHLVIAPRHVERRKELLENLQKIGLTCSLRSEGMNDSAELLLLDTTGELSRWYPLAAVVFVGKSLPCSSKKGGQNMIEPLQAKTPVLIGPHTGNFEPLATRLCDAGAALRVSDANSIISAIKGLLHHPEKRTAMVSAAEVLLRPHQEATQQNCLLVERLMNSQPLRS